MPTSEQRKILVVEDEVIVARDIRLQLELLGYRVVGELRSGREAVEQINDLAPDLVLMDIQLAGDMSGIEAARQILDTTGTPVVFLTAYASGPILEEAKTVNPAGYILKPFEERELRIVLEMAFYKAKVEYELRLKSNALSAAANAVVITDRNGVIEWANKAFTRFTGYTPEEAYGKNPANCSNPANIPPNSTRTCGPPSPAARSGTRKSSTGAKTAPPATNR
jgi:CheY-like chemotaxis protein